MTTPTRSPTPLPTEVHAFDAHLAATGPSAASTLTVPARAAQRPVDLGVGISNAAWLAWAWMAGVPLAVGLLRLDAGARPGAAFGAAVAWAGVAGLLGSGLMVWRSPRLARALGGWEAMVQTHHRLGVAGYALLLAHPLWLAWRAGNGPAAGFDAALAWAVLWPWTGGTAAEVATLDDGVAVAAGWLALLGLMGGLAVTFRPQWPYRLWRRLHVAMIAAVAVALAHVVLLQGWHASTVVAVAAGVAVFGARRGLVDTGLLGQAYRVSTLAQVAPGVVEATLRPEGGRLHAEPGQFVLARFQHGGGYRACGEFHPFTVSAVGRDGALRVAIKALGPCTWRLQGLHAGVPLRLQGPFGAFLQADASVPQLWVAGGIGITPFLARLRQGPCAVPTHLLYLVPQRDAAPFVDELQALAATDPALHLQIATTGTVVPTGDDLAGWIGQLAPGGFGAVQVCGPPGLLAALRPVLQARGVPPSAIHAERFDPR